MIKKVAALEFGGKYNHWIMLLSSFVFGQASVQIFQLLTGFLLVRWLTVEQYAQYTLVTSFQNVANVLVDLGVSGTIVALVGRNYTDKEIFGKYIKAAVFYRNRVFVLVAIGALVCFLWMVQNKDWSLTSIILLYVSILVFIFFNGYKTIYKSPLVVFQKLQKMYSAETFGGAFRLIFTGGFFFFGFLNSWVAALINSISVSIVGLTLKKWSSKYYNNNATADPKVRDEMRNYLTPVVPGLVFSAFQGQIMVFLISIFGQNEGIAEVGALGRVGQIFVFLNTIGNVIVAPYIAKVSNTHLLKKYIQMVALATFAAFSISIVGFIFPQYFLLLLGPKYAHLHSEVGLIIMNASLMFLGNILWAIQGARKWVYKWMPYVGIPGTLLVQLICIFFLDLSSTYNVLIFSVFTSLFYVFLRIGIAIYSFKIADKTQIAKK